MIDHVAAIYLGERRQYQGTYPKANNLEQVSERTERLEKFPT